MKTFIALPIDNKVTKLIKNKVDMLKNQTWSNHINWYIPDNFHITLQFLGGKLDDKKVLHVLSSMDFWLDSTFDKFNVKIESIQLFPDNEQPHTIVASIEKNKKLEYLVEQITKCTKSIGLEKAKLTFKPHISLGRIKCQSMIKDIEIPNFLKNFNTISLTVNKITLFESIQTHQAPIYKELKSIYLTK